MTRLRSKSVHPASGTRRAASGIYLAALLVLVPRMASAAIVPVLRPLPRAQLIAVADRQHLQVVKLRTRARVARSAEGKLTMDVVGSEASGVLVGEGLVLTALHTVALPAADGRLQPVEDIEVLIAGHGAFPARLAGGAPDLDIAVLEVRALRNLPGAPLATTDPAVGDSLIALGAVGESVEAVGVTVKDVGSLGDAAIKIDTAPALTKSFAGGPLFNEDGQVAALITPAGDDGAAVTATMLEQILAKARLERRPDDLPAGAALSPEP